MKFVDECTVSLIAGSGGNGCVAFRREKFIPHGGPSGGDGGRGADIVFETDPGMSTLLDFTHIKILRAKHGEHGMGSDCYGRGAADLVIRVPTGTQVFDEETNELLFDLSEPNVKTVVAKGGRGGRGNMHFATSFDRAPRRAEPGEPGQERHFRLELKVMADVGLLGFPNVGKSTFISAVSAARPKIASYPFTTLQPHLGVVSLTDDVVFVLADIPGLIPGAADGVGLGHRFLKHVERTRALLHLITLDPSEGRDPLSDYEALQRELARFDPALAKRPQVVAMSKADLPEVREAYAKVKPKFAKKKIDLHLVSAATGEGVRELLFALYAHVSGRAAAKEEEEAFDDPEPTTERRPSVASLPDEPDAAEPSTQRKPKTAPATKAAKTAAPAKKAVKTAKKKAAAAKPMKLQKTVAGRKANYAAKHASASPKKQKLMDQNRAKGKATKAGRVAAKKANVNRPKKKGR